MNYQQTIEYLFNSTPVFENVGSKAYKEGLYNSHELDKHFHHPHTKYRTIHIAGTNGKGSCSHTLAAILQAQGYKVGLYTSPHLIDFRERIRVNGECIGEQYVIDFVEQERYFFEPLHPSFFELTTALAFKYFADQHIDIAVVEVGLGGRLDCTNIITPLLSIITNISFDHTQFLGDTLLQIATEKAGIIKHGIPVVIGENNVETRPVFQAKAEAEMAPIFYAEDDNDIIEHHTEPSTGICYATRSFGNIIGELRGNYQSKNTNSVLCAIKVLRSIGILISTDSVKAGFANVCKSTGLMGRWQQIQCSPLVVCDTGHNVGGWQYTSKQIAKQMCHTLRIVFGMVDDKDIAHVMALLPEHAVYYFTQATTHRAIPSAKVAEIGMQYGLCGTCHNNVSEAYMAALADADADDFVFVGGSSYVVADLLTFLAHCKH